MGSKTEITRHLAHELKLTKAQRAFVEALVKDPKRNQTKAAEAAGIDRSRSAVQGSRWMALGKIQQYLAHLTSAAVERAEQKTEGVIADLAECLAHQTMVMRSKLPDYLGNSGEINVAKLKKAPAGLIRKIKIRSTTDEKGQVYAEHELQLESGSTAAQALIRHYDGLDVPQRPAGGNLTVVIEGDPQLAAALIKAVFQRSGTPRAIPVEATVVR